MAVMNNTELTRSVEMINAQITDLSSRLGQVVPEIYQKISDSESDIRIMATQIQSSVQPMVDGFAPLQQKVSLETQRLDNLGVNLPQAIADLGIELKNKISGVEA